MLSTALWESFGGKIYWFATGSEYDGMVIGQLPDDLTSEALLLVVRGLGNTARIQAFPLITSEEFKAAMEKADNIKSSYTPPTTTKQ
jgi:uncharacterized protein with GYD domain